MNYLGKFDIRFITFVNRKYNKRFRTFDDYSQALYEKNHNDYYYNLERDIKEYVKWQVEAIKKW